ncbi:MAG: class I SAM-dependent DNA methyltransferase [Actinomycetota bacterium]|nr:class I SAM-dependent DNA methyltransferase [Actinomycetota bacterium]
MLAEAAKLDWGSVEPAVFGTLFERSLDPDKRSQLGAQYTGKEDILRVVEPVLMAPLRREWERVRAQVEAEATAEELPRDPSARTRAVTRIQGKAQERLEAFAGKIRSTRVLDPACGSGNFLYVSLSLLLDLEKEVSVFAGRYGCGPFFPEVGPHQVFGIERDPYAHELAQVSVWIGYLQWMNQNGFGSPPDPVLGPMTNVVEMDALLRSGQDGYSEPEWPEADVVVGNPPFLGNRKMRSALGDGYVKALRGLYEGRVPGAADLVAYWFERARGYVESGQVSRVGLLATNGIRHGANRRVLERVKQTGDIFFAESDRPWVQDGAAVRVSMVGFDDGSQEEKILDGLLVSAINANLTADLDLTAATRLPENAGVAYYGTVKIGPFNVDGSLARGMLAASGNPNGRPNSDVVRPWMNARDVTQRLRGRWAVDFGVDTPLEDAALYGEPFEYLLRHAKPMREGVRRKKYRETWWLFGEPGPGLRRALAPLRRYIATPYTAKHRLFVWLDRAVLPDHQLVAIARDDDYFFGVLHSRAHEAWAVRQSNHMGKGNDPRYSPTVCFETFPFPWPPGLEPAQENDPRVAAVGAAARRLYGLRCKWLNPEGLSEAQFRKRTLTNLYNDRPTWLTLAHADLDRAVFACYGWEEEPEDLAEQEILERLLALNRERAEASPEGAR